MSGSAFVDMVEYRISAKYDLILPAFRANMSIQKNREAAQHKPGAGRRMEGADLYDEIRKKDQ